MARKMNAEGYFSPTEYAAFRSIEKEEKCNRHIKRSHKGGFRPFVYICSPYSGNILENSQKAKKYSRFAVDMGCIPITPHIYFTQFMDDNSSNERKLAMYMNMALLNHCQELWVFGDYISNGMEKEIRKAHFKNMKIRWFSENLHEKQSDDMRKDNYYE